MGRVQFNIRRHTYSYTDDGYMGLGPKLSQRGDELCVIPKLSVPFVMRWQSDGYGMVGPCFVLSFIKHKAIHIVNNSKLTVDNIVIN